MYTIAKIVTIRRPWGVECRYTAVAAGLPDINNVVPIPPESDSLAVALADLERQTATVPPDIREKPSIFAWLEEEKEALKWSAIYHMRENPATGAATYMQSLTWKQQNIVGAIVYQYAANAAESGMCQDLPNDDFETCWAAVSGIVNQMSIEQLQELL
jgi:hypothetical protein